MNKKETNDLIEENKKISQELHDMRYKKEINRLQEVIDKAIEYIKEEKEEYEKGKLLYKEFGRELEQYTKGQLVAYKHIEDILKGGKNE